jgi:hypothetical protein
VCSSNWFPFIHFRTLCAPRRFATPFPSITSALFSMQRRGWGYVHRTGVKVILELPAPSSSPPYILPSSVCSKSFVSHSYENCRRVPKLFPNRNANILAPLAPGFPRTSAFPTLDFLFSDFALQRLLGEDNRGAAVQAEGARGAAFVHANFEEAGVWQALNPFKSSGELTDSKPPGFELCNSLYWQGNTSSPFSHSKENLCNPVCFTPHFG